MNILPPSFISKTSVTDVVGFNIQGTETGAASGTVSFGQSFAEGSLHATEGLTASLGGVLLPVQVDAKTFYSDGSVQFAVLTLAQPSILPNQTLSGMLSIASSPSAIPPVSLSSLLAAHDVSITLSFADGSSAVVDIGNKLQAALDNRTAEIWLNGPIASQARVTIPISGSLRLVATVTAFADGTFSSNISFNNDIAMSSSGGAVTYTATVLVDGQVALTQPTLTQAQYQNWNATVWGGGGRATTGNIQHDPFYLETIKAIPNFDLVNGVDANKVPYYASQIASSSWGLPLSANGVTQAMSAAGGRPDIGITTEANATWLITQNATASELALGQAAASGSVPWNMWDEANGNWLNTDAYPNIWIDGRGGPSSYTTGLTQQVSNTTGWGPDTAHQPDLTYYAYLMTGDEKYLDSLNAQASFDITQTWPAWRGAGQLVVGSDQVRGSAWNLREIDEAAWANPAGSKEGIYFQKIMDVNWKWLVAQIPSWTLLQGQAYGQIEGYAWGTANSRPWMQDYFASVAAEAARHGNQDALTVLKWESNFLVGRFLSADLGFNPHDGIVYNLILGAPDGSRYQTWAAIQNAGIAANSTNGDGFSQSVGDYGELALETLADIISVTGSTDAIKAYNWLLQSGAPFIGVATRSSDVQFNISPVVPAGWSILADGTIVRVLGLATPETENSNIPRPGAGDQSASSSATDDPGQSLKVSPANQIQANGPPDTNSQNVQNVSGTIAVYRFFDTSTGTHFVTSDPNEAISLVTAGSRSYRADFISEKNDYGAISTDAAQADQNAVTIYRLFDKSNGTHFLTASKAELDGVTTPGTAAYQSNLSYDSNSGFYEHLTAAPGDIPIYRFFDTIYGTHFYTGDKEEYRSIVTPGVSGFRPDLQSEGIAFYAPSGDYKV